MPEPHLSPTDNKTASGPSAKRNIRDRDPSSEEATASRQIICYCTHRRLFSDGTQTPLECKRRRSSTPHRARNDKPSRAPTKGSARDHHVSRPGARRSRPSQEPAATPTRPPLLCLSASIRRDAELLPVHARLRDALPSRRRLLPAAGPLPRRAPAPGLGSAAPPPQPARPAGGPGRRRARQRARRVRRAAGRRARGRGRGRGR